MAVYIKLDDAVEAFKKAEEGDKANFVKYGILTIILLISFQQKELLRLSANVTNI